MQVILDSSFARPGSAPIWGGKKGEFRDWPKPISAWKVYFRWNARNLQSTLVFRTGVSYYAQGGENV